jgi:glycosyltransferase involved in cell wall biosynthesis
MSDASRPRVLVMSACWPHVDGGIQAAEIVGYEIARCLQVNERCDVVYGCASFTPIERTPAARRGMAALEALGVRFLPFIPLAAPQLPGGFLEKWVRLLVRRDPALLVPGTGQHGPILQALSTLGGWKPDVVIPVWSYEVTAAAAGLPCVMYAFYGNPDHKVYQANLRLFWRWERRWSAGWLLRHVADRLRVRAVERVHLAQLRRYDLIAENAFNDAKYYEAQGVRGVHYLRNLWPNPPADDIWVALRDALEKTDPIKIAGNLGHIDATGNTFGLLSLGSEIVPALKRRLGSDQFEMHVYGRRQPRAFVARHLDDPTIRLRGFVDDIETELLSCPVFLLANNRFDFKVGHTRVLHAFALGACVVAWRDTALAMPELVHDRNILLADNPDQMAELIVAAGRDRSLRRRIGREAVETLRQYFNPDTNIHEMGERIHAVTGRRAEAAIA